MATLPLDLDGLLDELSRDASDNAQQGAAPSIEQTALPAGTRIGHVHLQVSELSAIEDFYSGVLGLDVMVRAYPGALFVAAGGYHHHIGLNTWHSAGAAAPPRRRRAALVRAEAARRRLVAGGAGTDRRGSACHRAPRRRRAGTRSVWQPSAPTALSASVSAGQAY